MKDSACNVVTAVNSGLTLPNGHQIWICRLVSNPRVGYLVACDQVPDDASYVLTWFGAGERYLGVKAALAAVRQ